MSGTPERQWRVEWMEHARATHANGEWRAKVSMPSTESVARRRFDTLHEIAHESPDVRGVVLLSRVVGPWEVIPPEKEKADANTPD